MNDLITLNCPSCGGSLQVGTNTSVLVCEHCGVEHFVRRESGSLSLESYARCPKCGRNDRVEKVSAILRKAGKSSPPSDLSKLLTPPQKPDLLPEPKQKIINMATNDFSNATIIVFALSGIGLFIVLILLYTIGFKSENLFCIVPTLFLMGLTWFLKKKSDERKVEIAEEYQQKIKMARTNHLEVIGKIVRYNNTLVDNWKIAYERWERLYYCNRDDCLFIPGESRYVRVDEMEKLINRGLPKPIIDKTLKTQIINQSSSPHQHHTYESQEKLTANKPKQPQQSYQSVINRCSNCGSSDVSAPRRENMSCVWLIIIFVSWGLGLIFWFMTPKYVTCHNCGAKWRA
jgi:predicted RNA-binding Zn-ribbon protein involved in translation (DUF1610 family)